MKKIILTLITIVVLTAASAQINKGTILLGASSALGYNSYHYKNSSSNSSIFNINTKVGYFVADNFTIGANLGYLNSSQSGGSSASYTEIGAFIRYYFPKNVFFGVGINSVTSSSSAGSFGSSSNTNTAFPVELGFAAFISEQFAIEPSIRYISASDKGGVTYTGIDTGANSSFGLNIGFSFYPGRSKE